MEKKKKVNNTVQKGKTFTHSNANKLKVLFNDFLTQHPRVGLMFRVVFFIVSSVKSNNEMWIPFDKITWKYNFKLFEKNRLPSQFHVFSP